MSWPTIHTAVRSHTPLRIMRAAIIDLTPVNRRVFFAQRRAQGWGALNKLSDDERSLLRYYAETERILHGPVRGAIHQHLLNCGYIEERTVDTRGALVVVTATGRRALRNRS
jgi:hypothetical protein